MGGDPSSYVVEIDPPDLDVDQVHRWMSLDTYWARGRSRPVVEEAVAASTNLVARAAAGDHTMIGYARIVGDGVTYAWVCDVYVTPEHRGRGVGLALVSAVDRHLRGLGVRRAMLATEDAHGLYERFGFEPLRDGRFLARSYADPAPGSPTNG